jgi:hypothetical protein
MFCERAVAEIGQNRAGRHCIHTDPARRHFLACCV